MKSAGANELVAAVERATGYRVTVDTVEAIAEDAQMASAQLVEQLAGYRPVEPLQRGLGVLA